MDWLLPIFQLLYFVVHFLFSLAEAVVDCFYELYHQVCNIFWWKRRFIPSHHQLMKDSSHLKKLPRHLGFVLASKQSNQYKYICHVINWAVGFGINIISLYDIEGLLKIKLPSLLDNLGISYHDVTFRVIVDGQLYFKESQQLVINHTKGSSESSIQLNTGTPNTIVTLNILSIEDGKDNIVDITRAASLSSCKIVGKSFIQSNLITKNQVDPDLVIVLGRPMCILGFLPWQTRLTEFLNIPSVTRLDYRQFHKQLKLYSKCQQRCGS